MLVQLIVTNNTYISQANKQTNVSKLNMFYLICKTQPLGLKNDTTWLFTESLACSEHMTVHCFVHWNFYMEKIGEVKKTVILK